MNQHLLDFVIEPVAKKRTCHMFETTKNELSKLLTKVHIKYVLQIFYHLMPMKEIMSLRHNLILMNLCRLAKSPTSPFLRA